MAAENKSQVLHFYRVSGLVQQHAAAEPEKHAFIVAQIATLPWLVRYRVFQAG